MKKLLLAGLLLTGLASCSKDSADPKPTAPALTGNPWVFQSEVVVTTPKSGGAATTTTRPISAGSYKLTFGTGGMLTTTPATGTATTGTYTYSGNTITIPYTTASGTKTQTLTVAELGASKLVTTENTEDTTNRYLTTDTFTR